ncbi:hypothetical protein K7H20_13990 [Salipiger manganoxidans]|uniref:hypothetical protein n=1 Tax=Salipiger marinus TaxID=555512 RepID=UPI001E35A114|nr:hypothetical protein [Salipiger manganoxidans]MCD1619177.1 hypothetical protein [Salipiger manganoxidans]
MTTDHTPDPLALVAAAWIDGYVQAETRERGMVDQPGPPDGGRAAYDAALAQARAEGQREGIEAAAVQCYKDQGRFDTPDRIRALSDAPAPAVTVGEAARLLDEMTHHHLPLQLWREADTECWVLVDGSTRTVIGSGETAFDALRALAEGGAGR